MRSLLAAALLACLLVSPTAAPARERRVPTLSVETSLGPLRADGERALRARGHVPRGSRVTVTFLRGKRKLERFRFRAHRNRYRRATAIDRTGSYRIRVVARTRSGVVLQVTARLKYGPKAEAPSAPDPGEEPEPGPSPGA